MIASADLNTPEGVLSELLTGAAEALDIPPELESHARWRYEDIGTYLNKHGDALGGADWNVYPQGSFLLGTVVSPAVAEGDYDVDLVCLRMIEKTSTTQVELKQGVGEALGQYVRVGDGIALAEGGRCWTLQEAGLHFHSDVLPAIPDADGSATGILLTDRDFARWLKSDPLRYAQWFKDRMKVELLEKRAKLAEVRKSKIEDIPDSAVKTTLQRSVQVLKRHRDWHFRDDPMAGPPSILITTLAAHAYKGEQNLFEAVAMMAEAMPLYIQRDGTDWCVPNPVQPEEDFADKWRTEPDRHRNFMRWLETVKGDLSEILQVKGIPLLSERMAKSFGETVVKKSAARLGQGFKDLRETGKLTMGVGSGLLSTGTTGTRQVKPHGFYGAEDSES
jgi:hypothetical protein